MTTRALTLPGLRDRSSRTSRFPDRRASRRTVQRETEGTSLTRLVGIAFLGWFGLMLIVTAFAL